MATTDLRSLIEALRQIYKPSKTSVEHHKDCAIYKAIGLGWTQTDLDTLVCTCPDWHRAAQALKGMASHEPRVWRDRWEPMESGDE